MGFLDSLFGSGETTTQTQTDASVSYPKALVPLLYQYAAMAQNLGNKDPNQTVAGFSPDKLGGFDALRKLASSDPTGYFAKLMGSIQTSQNAQNPNAAQSDAADALGGLTGGNATVDAAINKLMGDANLPQIDSAGYRSGPATDSVSSRTFDNAAAEQYMSPYQTQVIDKALARFEEGAGKDRADSARERAGRGAFGSRSDLSEMLEDRAIQDSRGKLVSDLLASGYDAAKGQFNVDTASSLDAQKSNQGTNLSAGLAGLQASLQGDIANQGAATDAAKLGQSGAIGASNAALDLAKNQTGAATALGALGTDTSRTALDAAKQTADLAGSERATAVGNAGLLTAIGDEYENKQQQVLDAPWKVANQLGAAALGAPTTSSSTSTSTGPSGAASPLSQLAGLGLSAYGIAKMKDGGSVKSVRSLDGISPVMLGRMLESGDFDAKERAFILRAIKANSRKEPKLGGFADTYDLGYRDVPVEEAPAFSRFSDEGQGAWPVPQGGPVPDAMWPMPMLPPDDKGNRALPGYAKGGKVGRGKQSGVKADAPAIGEHDPRFATSLTDDTWYARDLGFDINDPEFYDGDLAADIGANPFYSPNSVPSDYRYGNQLPAWGAMPMLPEDDRTWQFLEGENDDPNVDAIGGFARGLAGDLQANPFMKATWAELNAAMMNRDALSEKNQRWLQQAIQMRIDGRGFAEGGTVTSAIAGDATLPRLAEMSDEDLLSLAQDPSLDPQARQDVVDALNARAVVTRPDRTKTPDDAQFLGEQGRMARDSADQAAALAASPALKASGLDPWPDYMPISLDADRRAAEREAQSAYAAGTVVPTSRYGDDQPLVPALRRGVTYAGSGQGDAAPKGAFDDVLYGDTSAHLPPEEEPIQGAGNPYTGGPPQTFPPPYAGAWGDMATQGAGAPYVMPQRFTRGAGAPYVAPGYARGSGYPGAPDGAPRSGWGFAPGQIVATVQNALAQPDEPLGGFADISGIYGGGSPAAVAGPAAAGPPSGGGGLPTPGATPMTPPLPMRPPGAPAGAATAPEAGASGSGWTGMDFLRMGAAMMSSNKPFFGALGDALGSTMDQRAAQLAEAAKQAHDDGQWEREIALKERALAIQEMAAARRGAGGGGGGGRGGGGGGGPSGGGGSGGTPPTQMRQIEYLTQVYIDGGEDPDTAKRHATATVYNDAWNGGGAGGAAAATPPKVSDIVSVYNTLSENNDTDATEDELWEEARRRVAALSGAAPAPMGGLDLGGSFIDFGGTGGSGVPAGMIALD